ncbi:double-strand break repair helicase AddA [Microvirga massiliensis]|uniref:double-strand break repair helicase AddA n=1 Tax=Microvirga massiliensis TaxID=1033741 RepID=UPI00062B9F78|nr:double-strand break repair helicase AddA [Microvirga massiliensis]
MTRTDLIARIVHEQRRAANPTASAWVSANAGSGKTKVLSDRVLRLMLAGTAPGRILCLTFTKAAAANMAIRIFERLGRWVTLPEEALTTELAALEGRPPSRHEIRQARRLFARAVETPGGLKIDTLHAFCERILHMVPFEANVPARFSILDDEQANELLEEALETVLSRASDSRRGDGRAGAEALSASYAAVSALTSGRDLNDLVRNAVRQRWLFQGKEGITASLEGLRAALGLAEGTNAASVRRRMMTEGLPPAEWTAIGRVLLESRNKTDRERGQTLCAAAVASTDEDRLQQYRSFFFKKDGEPRAESTLVTKAVDSDLKARLLAEQSRLADLDDGLRAAEAFERTAALFTLAAEIRTEIERRKARLGALDFDDLIARTLALLSRGDAAWILYKLDRGVDHILIDEAQDTNPDQWRILRLITEDFTAGLGATADRVRTVFAVGDPKQSIYGFQGAEPREFEASRRYWRKAVTGAQLTFEEVPLQVSWRSCRAVLRAVDATFGIEPHLRGLSFDEGFRGTEHDTTVEAPGCVELWPIERPAQRDDPEAWTLPVDEPLPTSPPVVVAQRIARAVRSWIHEGDRFGRRARPGDILVLVKKRGPAFLAVIRALRQAGVPVAGADRLDIGKHIAVQDLVAVGRAALLPDDDLSLAAAAKSPLVGLDDDDLIRIAATREETESFAAALHRHADAGEEAALRATQALASWRELARAHGPFGFYATLLGPGGGRRAFVARLGSEAGDAIDAFLCMAHQAEQVDAPSLTTFLTRFDDAEHEVKRDLDATGDEVRVMTVHGAKGLEAPIVVLIDGCQIDGPSDPLLPIARHAETGQAIPVWCTSTKQDSQAIREAREQHRLRGLEEHNRLLYVAMTRAKERLVIAPYMTSHRATPEEAWCAMIRRGLAEKLGAETPTEAPYGPVDLHFEDEAFGAASAAAEQVLQPLDIDPPDWLSEAVSRPMGERSFLSPSQAAQRPASSSRTSQQASPAARLRGTLVHALLEHLPTVEPPLRREVGQRYLAARAPRLSERERSWILGDVLTVMEDPELAPLFGTGSRAEVAITGTVMTASGPQPVLGQIDRLAVAADAVLLADFKSTRQLPDPDEALPDSQVLQLALYRQLLQELHPAKPVRALLVYTRGPLVREIEPAALDAALARL